MFFSNIVRLFREVRLRRFDDLAYRMYYALLTKTGVLASRFASVDPTNQAFLDALQPGTATTMEEFVERFDRQSVTRFYFDPFEKVSQPTPDLDSNASESVLMRRAEQVVQQRFSYLGSPEVYFPDKVDWHHCLDTEDRWPQHHWTKLDHRQTRMGDIKVCWEWNRHHCFVLLGRAYRQTGNERFVDAYVRLLESWFEQNPPEMGIHYTSNLEIGFRCVSWLWAHHLMAPSQHYPSETRGRLHLWLFYMARHLANNLSYTVHTGRNNHLIGDASCLAVYCLMYPEVQPTKKWLDRSIRILWQALREQFHRDGIHFELSFGYHQLVLEFYLQVLLLLRKQGQRVPDFVSERVEAMLNAVVLIRQPDGELPNFNDDDNASVWSLHDSPRQRLELNARIGSELFDRPDWLTATTESQTEGLRYLLPAGGRRRSDKGPLSLNVGLEHSGVFVMRSGWGKSADYALINNHPDPFPNSGHNHASLLQLLLWMDGFPILTDGGCYRYNHDKGFRNPLRSTHAHNTVVVDNLSQAEPSRNFGWLSKLRPGKCSWEVTEKYVLFDGHHDSYTFLPESVRHRRSVAWWKEQRVWIVRDQLTGKGIHQFQQLWHFHRDLHVHELAGSLCRVDRDGEPVAGVQFGMRPGDSLTHSRGSPDCPWSWESPSYGSLQPRTSYSFGWTDAVPTTRMTVFFPWNLAANGSSPVVFHLDDCVSVLDTHFQWSFEADIPRLTVHCS